MNCSKKVALIACPWTFYREAEFVSQQLGLSSVGAYAEQFGHKIVAFIDPIVSGGMEIKTPVATRYQLTNRFGHSDAWIVSQIPGDTEVIGINAPFTDSRLTLYPLVKMIKEKFPAVLLVVGGVLATTLPLQVIEESVVDIVVKGEGEIPFSRILNGDHWEAIPGLVFRKPDGAIFESPSLSEQLRVVDKISLPRHDFRPMREYTKWSPRGNKGDKTLSMVSSRGCPFACEFCSLIAKGKQLWRPFTPERVLDEIKTAIKNWGVNHIEFEDDNFTFNEARASTILRGLSELRSQGVPISCSFPNGVMIDKMTESLAKFFVSAGTEIIYLPVESGDPRVLMSMNKPQAEHHLEKTLTVAKWCVDAGLFVSSFFILAYPGGRLNQRYLRNPAILEKYRRHLIYDQDEVFLQGEDEEAYENTVSFCRQLRKLGVGGITPLIATPYPGTGLYNTCKRLGWLTFEDNHDVLVTMSYAEMEPGLIQISTPWCSPQRAFERWEAIVREFPTYHNIRKSGAGLQMSQEMRRKG